MTFNAWTRMFGRRTRCFADCRLNHANSEGCNCPTIKLKAAMELLGYVDGGYLHTLVTECRRVLPIDIHVIPNTWQWLVHEIDSTRLYSAPERIEHMAATARRVDVEVI